MLHVRPHELFVLYRPAIEGALPTVLHVPGFNEDAWSAAPFALRLAEAGFQCAALNPPWRNTPSLQNPSPALLFELMDEAEQTADAALARLAEESGAAAWLALTGFSMGGLFASRLLARASGHPFRAAGLVLATGDWSFLPRVTLNTFPDLAAALPPGLLAMAEQLLRDGSPAATPERFPPTPLLLLNSDRDPRLPVEVAQRFAAQLARAYQAAGEPEALTFDLHQGERHEFRRAMQRQLRDWLGAQWRSA